MPPGCHEKLVMWRYGLTHPPAIAWDALRKSDATFNTIAAICAANPGFITVASGGDGDSVQFCELVGP